MKSLVWDWQLHLSNVKSRVFSHFSHWSLKDHCGSEPQENTGNRSESMFQLRFPKLQCACCGVWKSTVADSNFNFAVVVFDPQESTSQDCCIRVHHLACRCILHCASHGWRSLHSWDFNWKYQDAQEKGMGQTWIPQAYACYFLWNDPLCGCLGIWMLKPSEK